MLKITLRRSPIGSKEEHKRTVRALGLRALHQSVYQPSNPSIRGMIARVAYLVEVERIEEPRTQRRKKPASKSEARPSKPSKEVESHAAP